MILVLFWKRVGTLEPRFLQYPPCENNLQHKDSCMNLSIEHLFGMAVPENFASSEKLHACIFGFGSFLVLRLPKCYPPTKRFMNESFIWQLFWGVFLESFVQAKRCMHGYFILECCRPIIPEMLNFGTMIHA